MAIRDEKLQYDINKEAGKISTLSSGKIDKYEYLTYEEILAPDQRRVIGQAQFAYSPLGKDNKSNYDRVKQQTNPNELIKKGCNIDRDGIPLEEEKKI